jgi:hypothetical protein
LEGGIPANLIEIEELAESIFIGNGCRLEKEKVHSDDGKVVASIVAIVLDAGA